MLEAGVDYWTEFYRTHQRREPSQFAHWCEPLFPVAARVLDVGGGDGRDAALFAQRGHDVTIIDPCGETPTGVRRERTRAQNLVVVKADVVYARWFLHAVPEEVEDAFLANLVGSDALLFIEARSDAGVVPGDHFRRGVNMDRLLQKMSGYEVFYAGESQGWSVDGDDDPLLVRVMAHA